MYKPGTPRFIDMVSVIRSNKHHPLLRLRSIVRAQRSHDPLACAERAGR